MDYNKFTREQVLFLTFAAGCSNMAYTFTWAVYLSKRSSWIVLAIGIMMIIPFAVGILYLCKNYTGYTIFDIIDEGFGRLLYIMVILFYSLITIALGAYILNMFVGSVKVYFLPHTPSWILMLFLVFMSFLFVNNRTLLFGRAVELLTIWYIFNYFIGFSLSFVKEFKIENVIPIFDTTLSEFGEGIFFSMGAASEILLATMVMVAHIPAPYEHRKWIVRGITLWAFILALAVFIMQGISGYEMLSRTTEAGIGVSRAIYIGDFVRGLEVFILATYQLITILKISLYIYGIWIPIKKLFNQKYSTVILVVITLLIFIPSVWLNSSNSAYFFSIFASYFVILPFVIIVMLLAWLGIRIIKRRSGGGLN
ncbi:GerAB/ArcD/ProY family transporter [Clostridiaceae bacterium UIB06]|uniref:GerAB/ArcD/ProY family transporter n=1 Tax=Clostridium thailandense TaxID=2794346 RepID=A0A949WTF0_9CLOT|nr:GerAB/ArcD/ProY family transporter [Clostridium thailandense]MBV7271402.1 GerAB/ArcD/ProY family transporter [Clostridium thailandense]MCH5136144.1 GerAB/ArcD/ProY family transporter [Clostridiaceae bacterium UIB06]